jgi:GT2 family glycosyltransferase
MTKMPVAGVVWQVLHYLIGLERLGYETYYVEAHARTPSMLMSTPTDDSTELAASYIHRHLSRFGLGQRWAFHALHSDGACLGMSRAELESLYETSAAIINLHGGTEPREELARTGRLIYLETDPVQLQIEIAQGQRGTLDFLDAHVAFFTFAANYGLPGCLLPVSERYHFIPTRQPVVLDFWPDDAPSGSRFTTIGNWKQLWRPVEFGGELLTWSKHVEFEKIRRLPKVTGAQFDLALSTIEQSDVEDLERDGWMVRNALDVSIDIDDYRSFITSSRAEFTVAKEQNVRLRTGWFSDRSATYLSSGRPVITQDTGYDMTLPVGEGLVPFSTEGDAVAAVESVLGQWPRHARAARAMAKDHFSHDVVLPPLLNAIGLSSHRRPSRARRPTGEVGLPPDLLLTPIRKHPTLLSDDTLCRIHDRPVARMPNGAQVENPSISVVIVTWNNLPFLRLALESILQAQTDTAFEIVAVDNATTDGTWDYMQRLSEANPAVITVRCSENLGFAGGVNAGAARASGESLVVVNDDIVVGDRWLDLLCRSLDDRSIGMTGPVTSQSTTRSDHEPYECLGDFWLQADRHAAVQGGRETDFLAMYCVGMRRETFELVGRLDENFGLGLFEDDDYCRRLRLAGYRIWCDESVLVHHFGETSIGKLRASGAYSDLFDTNRARYEKKWGTAWAPRVHRPRPGYDEYRLRLRAKMREALPAASLALIVSRGDDELLDVPGVLTRHFPYGLDGGYSGYCPADGSEAVAALRTAHADGAEYLVLPSQSSWWLSFYPELHEHLTTTARPVFDDQELARIYSLEEEQR